MLTSTIIHYSGNKRGVLTEGSLVYFFETNSHQFCQNSRQGFIEEIDKHSDEVTIRTIDGQIIKNISLHRVFL